MILTNIDNIYVKCYALLVVNVFNFGIVLSNLLESLNVRNSDWESQLKKNLDALNKWKERIICILTPEMNTFLNSIKDNINTPASELIQTISKSTLFQWGKDDKIKWLQWLESLQNTV